MKFCPNCGHQLEEGAKFCPSCGAQLTTESDKVSEKSPVEQPKVAAETTVNGDASRSENSYEEHRESQNNQANQQQLGFVGSVQYVVKHAFEFNGDVPESRKSVFWWAYLAYCLVVLILAFVPALGAIASWPLMIFLVAASMRRLAYINQNTGLGWLILVPVVGLYVFFLMVLDKKAE